MDEAFDGLGDTYDLFYEESDRDSIDDEGMVLNATVHFGVNYDNAFWDGSHMVFGDGDAQVFNRFTIAVDVTAHELTHGVTEHEAGLIYWGEAGALNESISDVFGSLVKQYRLGQSAAAADWLIGEGLLTAAVNGDALRSMSDPGSAYDDPLLGGVDPQPGHIDNYVHTPKRTGGRVHINSGIPNKAFHLAATYIGGNAWEAGRSIWSGASEDHDVAAVDTVQGVRSSHVLTARAPVPGGASRPMPSGKPGKTSASMCDANESDVETDGRLRKYREDGCARHRGHGSRRSDEVGSAHSCGGRLRRSHDVPCEHSDRSGSVRLRSDARRCREASRH